MRYRKLYGTYSMYLLHKRTKEQTNKHSKEQTNKQTNEHTNKRTNEQMNCISTTMRSNTQKTKTKQDLLIVQVSVWTPNDVRW